ncbi:MAG: DUF3857 domain-containing transglutaminase family protein [Acidobacteriota bacterium]
MRFRLGRAWVAAGLLVAASVPGMARSKHEPVPDWGLAAAKTPTPEYAKDAAAVVLLDDYLETVDAQGRATERHRQVMRILKPQGRDNACTVAYDIDDKINSFRAWTIAADDKIYQAQDTDFTDVGMRENSVELFTAKVRVAAPPAIDVGAVLVCESEELRAPYDREEDWHFQDEVPVVDAALEMDLPAGMKYAAAWHRFDAVQSTEPAPGHVRWELKDVPALRLRDIPSTPDWEALAGRMTVLWGDEAVAGTDAEWRAIGDWVTKLEAGRPDPSPEITANVQQLIAGAPDFYTKLSRITESIQKDVRYFIVERGIGGMQANYARDIFRNRYGDCKDKTTLLISMLQVAGITGHYLLVDHRRGVVDPNVPSEEGDHMVTAIEVPAAVNDPRLQAVVTGKDGKRYLIFDPTDERTPVGNLPANEQGSYGLMAAGDASQVLALPVLPPEDNGTDRKGQFTLAADGTLTGTVDASHMGPEGADWRMLLKYSDAAEQQRGMESYVAADLPGVTLNGFKFVQSPSFAKPLELHYQVTVPLYAHTAGTLLLVRPRVVGSDVQAFDDKPRKLPIDLSATGHWHDSFDITIPAGYVVDDTPDAADVSTGFASYKSKVTAKGNVLHYERDLVVKQVQIPAADAVEYRKLESAILTDEKGTAVLKRQ